MSKRIRGVVIMLDDVNIGSRGAFRKGRKKKSRRRKKKGGAPSFLQAVGVTRF